MARNVEIKARVRDPDATRRLVAGIAGGPPTTLQQTDTFFAAGTGRLKLREFSDAPAELICYERPDRPGPKTSDYAKAAVADADALRAVLTAALGVAGRVSKRRLLYWVGRTRVHLDEVEDLGHFLELEVVLDEDEPAERGLEEAERLMRAFGIEDEALVPQAYVDLLNQR